MNNRTLKAGFDYLMRPPSSVDHVAIELQGGINRRESVPGNYS